MEKRYNEELEQLIETVLTDGILTDKKKHVLFKKAESFGIDLDEFEMVLEARLYKMKQNNNVTESQNEVTPQQEEKPLVSEETKEKIKEGVKTTGKAVGKAAGAAVKAGMGIWMKVLYRYGHSSCCVWCSGIRCQIY